MFNPQSEVKHLALQLQLQRRDDPLPPLNVLMWQEERTHLALCLELDVLGEGNTPQKALHALAELVDTQLEFAKERNLDVCHPAPFDYWQKLDEIRTNRVRTYARQHPQQFRKAVVEELQHAYG